MLQARDVLESDEVNLTQEFLSHMLGVRRSSVTVVASDLQKKGAIKYHRGNIKIIEDKTLKKCSCDCYDVLRNQLKTYMG